MKIPSVTETARHLGLSRAAIVDLENTRVIDRRAGIDACRIAYIRHLRARPRADAAADAQFRLARAREVEARTAEKLGRYVLAVEYDQMIDQICGLFRSELATLPARIGRADMALRRVVEAECNGVLHRIADEAEKHAAHEGKAA